ncbi:grpE protein homolog, mitochondrial [Trichomonascus vanleenenianus]|uniref:mitochondrial nucleotide exchange factor MGE1 n=1 Tax=Trichomonascus vanleenenianus TaxID=2268995 RepID=UPI003ECB29F2
MVRPAIMRPAMARPVQAVRFYSEKPVEEAKSEEKPEAEETKTEEDGGLAEWETKYQAKDKEAAQLKDQLLRSIADFRNLQETTKREVQNARDYALQKFAKDLLESVDNFDRALSIIPEEKRNSETELANLYEGVKMVQAIFEKTLAKHGLEKMDPLGEKFDPNIHEATFEVPQPDKEPGTIFHVQQPGFSLNNRVLRAPKVGVVKGSE